MINTDYGYGRAQWINTNIQNLFEFQSDGSFFHYTSLANAIDMLKFENTNKPLSYAMDMHGFENKKMVLFASHFLYLNDSQEFQEGLSLLNQELVNLISGNSLSSKILGVCQKYSDLFSKNTEILKTIYPNHFVVSFCKAGNSLEQWKYYGKNCGVAIEYDLKNLYYDGFCTWNRKQLGTQSVFDVLYNKKVKIENIERILGGLKTISKNFEYETENIIMRACAAVSFMKSEFFENEEEARLLFAPIYNDNIALSEENNPMRLVNYREAGGKIKPYLRIIVKHKDINTFPIKSITIGPGHNQMQIFNAILMLVQTYYRRIPSSNSKDVSLKEDKDYNDGCKYIEVNGIRIRVSSIPYRE